MEREASHPVTTIAALRAALAERFGTAPARTALLRLREAGLLPWGSGGRGGSAEITTHHAALALLALISGEAPIDAPEVALLLGSYSLRAFYVPLIGPAFANLVPAGDKIDFLTFLSGEIEFAIDPNARVVGLYIEPNRISTLDPGEIEEFDRPAGDPPILRDIDEVRERLEFTPQVQRPKWDDRGRPLSHALSFVVRPDLIRVIGGTFTATRQAATLLSGGAA